MPISPNSIYSRIYKIRLKDVGAHKLEQMRELLLEVGCEPIQTADGGGERWRVPGQHPNGKPRRIRSAFNRCREACLFRDLKRGAEVPAYDDGRSSFLVWCVNCGRFHVHGRRQAGARVSHCLDRLGVYGDSYVLIIVNDADADAAIAAIDGGANA